MRWMDLDVKFRFSDLCWSQLPTDLEIVDVLATTVRLGIHVSFELHVLWCDMEQLRRANDCYGMILNGSAKEMYVRVTPRIWTLTVAS